MNINDLPEDVLKNIIDKYINRELSEEETLETPENTELEPESENEPTDLVLELFFKTNDQREYHTFTQALTAESNFNEVECQQTVDKMRSALDSSIKNTMESLSDIQYFLMEKSGDWAGYGQEQVIYNYMRIKLSMDIDQEVSEWDFRRFENLMNISPLQNYTVEQLNNLNSQNDYWRVFSKNIPLHHADIINRYLLFLESGNRVYVGKIGNYDTIIYGIAKESKKSIYHITEFQEEISRTPSCILPMIGLIGGNNIAIRQASAKLIYTHKWLTMFDYSRMSEDDQLLQMGQNIQVKALKSYQVHNFVELQKKKDLFLAEIMEGAVIHELGHGLFFQEILDVDDAGLSKAFSFFGGENVIDILREALADWCPKYGELTGPIQYFLDLALNGETEKAKRLLFVYISDNWFCDSVLKPQTILLVSLLLPFLVNGDFNWHLMAEKFTIIHGFLLRKHQEITSYVKTLLQQTIYKPSIFERDFAFIAEQVCTNLDKTKDNVTCEDISYKTAFWLNMFALCRAYSQDYERLLTYIHEQEKILWLELVDALDLQEVVNNGLEEYIIKQLQLNL